ncbi:uncharacterized protein LOC124927775 [Impatiens glandulifera]|uniref:uncharacterized protein LOC124927775 n=1 Tax=Impatiens glandulifera TaxID=253017 RepID=UPI001FB05FFA|nr:uncharacterized protein LOC124927775 [Impatiens glandulifera]
MSYNKAWRSREHALMVVRGTVEDSYGKLPPHLYMLEMNNPGIKDPRIAVYLEDIGMERWSLAFFPGKRYNEMTRNYAKSFNSQSREARKNGVIIEEKKRIITQNVYLNIMKSSYLSKLRNCRVFDVSSLPCKHALVAARTRKLDPYDFCSKYYSTEMWLNAYPETCYPVGDEKEWDIPEIIKCVYLKPSVKVKKGRPTTNRRSFQGETRKVRRRCSSCGGQGHNRETCKSVMPAPSTTRVESQQQHQPSS